mmetsp:Transcript_44110/g.86867  ORF Transcript_44110/g.86867 Transcript_44110/m.86867 type:complete len:137 (+) Transcript_44110:2-412(+)
MGGSKKSPPAQQRAKSPFEARDAASALLRLLAPTSAIPLYSVEATPPLSGTADLTGAQVEVDLRENGGFPVFAISPQSHNDGAKEASSWHVSQIRPPSSLESSSSHHKNNQLKTAAGVKEGEADDRLLASPTHSFR